MKTTIQIDKNTLKRLITLKQFERESYDLVLNKLLDEYEEEQLSEKELDEIQKGIDQIKRGKVVPIEEVAKEMGISLK